MKININIIIVLFVGIIPGSLLAYYLLNVDVKRSLVLLQKNYATLENRYDSLLFEFENITASYIQTRFELDLIGEKKRQDEVYSEEDAKKYLKDYYNFYNANFVYRNVRLRKIAYNEFEIALEECVKGENFVNNDFFWHSKVLSLTIHDDGTYKISSIGY